MNRFSDYDAQVALAHDKYIAAQLRPLHPDVPSDASDQDVIDYHKSVEAPNAPQDEYNSYLRDSFGQGFQPPKPTTPERVGQVAETTGRVAGAVVQHPEIVPKVAGAMAKGIFDAAFTTPAQGLAAAAAGPALNKAVESIPPIDRDSLKAKGYSDAQIEHLMQEHAKVVGEVTAPAAQAGAEAVSKSAEGMGFWGSTLIGAGAGAGMKAAGFAEKGLATAAAEGAAGFGSYNAIEAAANGEGADDILKKAATGAVTGAIAGPVIGKVIAGTSDALGKSFAVGSDILNQVNPKWGARSATREAAEKLVAAQTQKAMITKFANEFQPTWLNERFNPDYRAWVTNPSTALMQPATAHEVLATMIATKLYGQDAVQANPEAMAKLAEKIGSWMQTQDMLNGRTVALPSPPPAPETQTMGVNLGMQGGIGPMGAEPPAVQGRIGEQAPPFTPPTAPAPAGLQPSTAALPAAPPEQPVAEGAPPLPTSVEPAAQLVQPNEQNHTPIGTLPEAVQGAVNAPETTFTPPTGIRRETALQGPGEVTPAQTAVEAIKGLGERGTKPDLRTLGGVEYHITPAADGRSIELKSLRNVGGAEGASSDVLKTLAQKADEHGLPIEVNATPVPSKGGRIPIEKLTSFYEKHGFDMVETGDGWVTMRRTPVDQNPIPAEDVATFAEDGPGIKDRVEGLEGDKAVMAAGNVIPGKPMITAETVEPPSAGLGQRVSAQLSMWEDAAKARLDVKLKRMNSGIDPTMYGDLAIIGASKMFQLGIRSTKMWAAKMTELYGEAIKPHLDAIREKAVSLLQRHLADDKPTVAHMNALVKMAKEGSIGATWYNKTWSYLQKTFGDDAEMVARFVAATSAGNSTEGNATMALRAYGQWKLGLPFDGTSSRSIQMMLHKAARGEVFGNGKVQGFLGALTGDENAVALDRWMMRALGFATNEGGNYGTGKSAFGSQQYKLFASVLTDLARENNMTPREFQAAVWTAAKMQRSQVAMKAGEAVHHTGSFRTMDDLISRRLSGLTPAEWVEQVKPRLDQIKNISDGLVQAKEQGGGFTFDPYNYKESDAKGHLVTLASENVSHGELTPRALMNFRDHYSNLIDKYHNVTLGVWDMTGQGAATEPRAEGNPDVRSVVQKYNDARGQETPIHGYEPLDAEKGKRIAELYEALPKKPAAADLDATKKSYDALNREVADQYQHMQDAGYKIKFVKKDPYKNSAEMMADLRDNKQLKVLESSGAPHSLMTKEQNDKFRAVHDFFGHGAEGYQFGPRGEDNAWRAHASMFSNEAIPAMTTETRGQNSWVNGSKVNEGKAPVDRAFAEQKAGLLPDWTYGEALHTADKRQMSMDLNIVLPENMKDEAVKLGLSTRQFAIGHINPEGSYESVPTGYEPTKHGAQFLPPAEGSRRAAWYKLQNKKVDDLLAQIGTPAKDVTNGELFAPTVKSGHMNLDPAVLDDMVRDPAMALTKAGALLKKSPEEMKALCDKGEFTPMTDAGVIGAVRINRDGSAWEYVDPVGPSYNTMKLIGSLRGKNAPSVMDQLEGRDIIEGHDILQSYRSQAGFARIAKPKKVASSAEIERALIKTGATPVKGNDLTGTMKPWGMTSVWLTPDSKMLVCPSTHLLAASMVEKALKLPRLKDYEGGSNPAIQNLLNAGFVRLQVANKMVGIDAAADAVTDGQRQTIAKLVRERGDFALDVSEPNGKIIRSHSTFYGHRFGDALRSLGAKE